ncbi:MAG: Beta-lactamase class C-like and penicillin binding proteins (PBPs) superfamily [uncultured Thermomicrobiales bacterium]|uniref:Beta-lactamase class C-like and penicillin binding proteins (PBPs) superfamily n=1 Tax=uncultured Thermomicrobiales bacterium TaxID=1645740 RepID=A0A6J4VED7_9BACT|nr:MAG: Beta-lactamase class C-like and penicillin binding proteins (PBPs) superfamily [uncultured Thermomicrobiales bacterium]
MTGTGMAERSEVTWPMAPKPERLALAVAMVDDWVTSRLVPGVSLAVAWRGETVLAHAAGKVSAGGGGPVAPETRYPVTSLTKPVTAAAVMALIERGDLYLDEPVRRWLPEFATPTSEAARRQITARELLCHVAGLPKDDPDGPALFAREAPFAALVESAAGVPLAGPPGQRVIYSNVGYWVLGGLVAAAGRAPFAEVATGVVLQPSGLAGSTFTPADDEVPSLARRYGPDRTSNTAYGRRLGSPGGGLFATASDMARFAGAFAHAAATSSRAGGVSGASVRMMTTDQTATAAVPLPAPNPHPLPATPRRGDRPLPGGIPGMREWDACPWAFGWEVRGDKRDHWTGDLTSPDTICHIGQSGCLVWADPRSGLSLAVLANRDLGSGWATGGRPEHSPGAVDSPARWARLSDIVASSV